MSSDDDDARVLIAALPPQLADAFAARLAEGGVDLKVRPADMGRGWEVQIWVPEEQVARVREIEASFVREQMPDAPADFDPHAAPTSEGCPACGTPFDEGATECADCGLALPR